MAFRTVEISSHCKLEYSLNYLVFRTPKDTKRILLDEIQTLIIDSTAVALTTSLISELSKRNICVIFCDEKHNPESQLLPLFGSYESSLALSRQINWSQEIKDLVWKEIIKQKITWQGKVLRKYKPDDDFLINYCDLVTDGDATNCEGHAAKYYFNRVFFDGFTRDSESEINTFLNYGYSILLSEVNRCVAAKGYNSQLGIHHHNQFNPYNLSCDLMEPFRPIIDDYVHSLTAIDFKQNLIELFQKNVFINGMVQTLNNAIQIYVANTLKALDMQDLSLLTFFESYEL